MVQFHLQVSAGTFRMASSLFQARGIPSIRGCCAITMVLFYRMYVCGLLVYGGEVTISVAFSTVHQTDSWSLSPICTHCSCNSSVCLLRNAFPPTSRRGSVLVHAPQIVKQMVCLGAAMVLGRQAGSHTCSLEQSVLLPLYGAASP